MMEWHKRVVLPYLKYNSARGRLNPWLTNPIRALVSPSMDTNELSHSISLSLSVAHTHTHTVKLHTHIGTLYTPSDMFMSTCLLAPLYAPVSIEPQWHGENAARIICMTACRLRCRLLYVKSYATCSSEFHMPSGCCFAYARGQI